LLLGRQRAEAAAAIGAHGDLKPVGAAAGENARAKATAVVNRPLLA